MIAIVAISFVAKADPAKKVNLAYENGRFSDEKFGERLLFER